MSESVKRLYAYVSEDAHDLWHRYAEHHGMSIAEVMEAFAPRRTHEFESILQEARNLDANRRNRYKASETTAVASGV